ncbi:hypothetical protein FD723_37295 (plasmid) [Nostoc sp. C052]|uniref:hypothetical protein n=1 Tax=Nostoc sp. C052 TaxID=2576902 RepID=UPI0015C33250|nr:hypothetical protein [Nostoc sp. C052]QLE45493.1 hypothetical protein FD723_34915 [Nostoc sp. C052]QLE45882.1 hypothetical protein FD723_37295 [Nostoc sp. C052]
MLLPECGRDGLAPPEAIALVVRQPKIAGWRSAEEQGSRGAEERFVQVLSPLPLRTSASLLATTLALPWQTTSNNVAIASGGR